MAQTWYQRYQRYQRAFCCFHQRIEAGVSRAFSRRLLVILSAEKVASMEVATAG